MRDYTRVAVDAAQKEMYGLQTAAAGTARGAVNGALGAAARALQNGFKGFMEGAGSLFSGGIWDTTTAKIGAAAVAGGVAVAATAGTALGGAKTEAEKAVDRVADAAVGAAGAAKSFAANAAVVTAPVAAGAEPAPSGERTVPVAGFSAVPAKGGGATGVATDVSPKSDFNYAAPGAPLPALEATIEAGGGKFDQATYERARAQIAGIKPSGMG